MAIGPVIKFLQAVRNLTKGGAIKTIDQAFDFAKREFGQINDMFRKQINDAFNQGQKELTRITNKPKPSAEIIPFPKKKEGIETLKKEGDDELFQDTLKAARQMVKEREEVSPVMKRLESGIETLKQMKQPGMDLATGLTRTATRKILDRSGIKVPDKVDPIEVFEKNFGGDALMDVKDVAEEMIELERMGKSTKSMDEILEQSGMFDIKINPDAPKGMSDEQIEQIKKQVDQEKMFKDFDPKGRKPNAEGGINNLMASDDMNERLLEKLYEDFLEQGFSPEEAARKAREAFSERSNAAMGGRMNFDKYIRRKKNSKGGLQYLMGL